VRSSEKDQNTYAAILAELKNATPSEAIELLRDHTETYPDDAVAINDLGVTYFRSGNVEKALACYRQAHALFPQNPVFAKNLADLLFTHGGDLKAALKLYTLVLKEDPHDCDSLIAIGHINSAVNRYDDAALFYRRVLELEPAHKQAQEGLAWLAGSPPQDTGGGLGAVGREPVGASGSNRSDEDIRMPPGETASTSETMSSTMGSPHRSEPDVSVYLIGQRSLSDVRRQLAELESNAEHKHLVVLMPTELAATDMKTTDGIRGQLSNDCYITVPQERLSEVLAECLRTDPNPYQAILWDQVWVAKGWLRYLVSQLKYNPAAAIVSPLSNFASGVQFIDLPNIITRNEFHALASERVEAYRHQHIQAHTIDGRCAVITKRALEEIGGLDQSLPFIEAAVSDWCLRSRLANWDALVAGETVAYSPGLHRMSARNQKALTHKWNTLVKAEARWRDALLDLKRYEECEAKYFTDNLHAAIQVGTHGTPTKSMSIRVLRLLIEFCVDAKRFETADSFCRELLQRSDDARNTALAGMVKEGLGKVQEAQALADRALKLSPNLPEALNLKGVLAYGREEQEMAKSFFESAMTANPGYADAYANLATLWWSENRKIAFDYYERAFKLSPYKVDIAELYQGALDELGDYGKGERVIIEAIDRYPKVKLLRYLEIDLYLQMGRYEDAIQAVSEVLSKFPFDPDIIEPGLKIRQRLGPKRIVEEGGRSPSLALGMIVKNEEANIAKCLASVLDLVDEMIVVDTGSDDHTAAIATIMGATVVEHAWNNNFAEARNIYLHATKADWILVLDADEVISPKDHGKILNLTKEVAEGPVAYTVTTRNYDTNPTVIGFTANANEYPSEEQGNGWVPTHKVRIFRNDNRLSYSFPVHEMLEPCLKELGYQIKPLDVPVHHYGKLDKDKTKQKYQLYYQLGIQKLEETGDDAYSLRELAIQAGLMKRYDEAIDLWQRFLILQPDIPEAYINTATAQFHLKKYAMALSAARQAYRLAPHFRESKYNYALLSMHTGDIETATSVVKQLCEEYSDYYPGFLLYTCASFASGDINRGRKALDILRQTPLGPVLSESFRTFCKGLSDAGQHDYVIKIVAAASDEGYQGLTC
jgi:tetratricopeptide (TPR) repeat protein